jgi:hypothetical protein
MGICGTTYNWFKNYLAGRTRFADINGNRSDPLEINISVIQGSILGLILFLCYVTTFSVQQHFFQNFFQIKYDRYRQRQKFAWFIHLCKCELQKIANWFRANKMAVSTSKTKFIIFRTRGKRINPEDCRLVFNSHKIGSVKTLIWLNIA